MPLVTGSRLGPYEILGPLGAGGMGEVYRARDTRLDRSVALKVLPAHLTGNTEARQRLEREARAVSSLNHPHICTLHDVGEQDGIHFLVMEHLEGETLAKRTGRGSLPLDQALKIGIEIAEALAAAHRRGVIHRDLKPGNVMLTKAGAKLLDFGLAKRGPDAAPPISSAVMTEASPLTAPGTIVGTWQYMSPEQLEGDEADARSDIFAFGALLYEMVTGRPPFAGRSQASLIAAIMGTEPPEPSSITPGCPPALNRVVRRCLAKDPDERWQSAADLASELKWIGAESTAGGAPGSAAHPPPLSDPQASGAAAAVTVPGPASRPAGGLTRRERLAWAAVTVVLLAATAFLAARTLRGPGEPPRPMQAALLPPLGERFDARFPPAVSPDGRAVAFVAVGDQGQSRLWVRDLAAAESRLLPETSGAAFPFWSPDGRWLAFYAEAKLKKIDTAGGPAIPLCDAQDGRGGSWSPQGVILFEPRYNDPLFKVSAGGGVPEPVTKLEESRFEISHRWPHFLPDGRRFLFHVVSTTNPSTSEHSGIYAGSLDAPATRQLLRLDSKMEYAQGHLLYRRGTTLMAHPFDPARAAFTGDPLPLAGDIAGGVYSWAGAKFGVSEQGVLVFLGGAGQGESELVWFDRTGRKVEQVGEREIYWDPRISHDGRRIVVGIGRDASDLWLHDLVRDVRTRSTFDPADDSKPVWSPDDTHIIFTSGRKGMGEMYRRDASGTGVDELLYSAGTPMDINDWSPDGRFVIFSSLGRDTSWDLWVYSLDDKKARPWIEGAREQLESRFSPDGRWVAYTSDESGRSEVYVQGFSQQGGGRWQVSKSGGSGAAWRSDGKELYYLGNDGALMAVDVRTGAAFDVGTPRPLFKVAAKAGQRRFDPAPDGQRFLVNSLGETDPRTLPATLLLNWKDALKR